jgi:hypothetical protein
MKTMQPGPSFQSPLAAALAKLESCDGPWTEEKLCDELVELLASILFELEGRTPSYIQFDSRGRAYSMDVPIGMPEATARARKIVENVFIAWRAVAQAEPNSAALGKK